MCGIIVAPKNKLTEILENQEYRGLDSLGIVTMNAIYKAIRGDLEGYKKYISGLDNEKGLFIAHHRKATIGSISLENSHPFYGDKFVLMQNGTSKLFHKETTHKEDVDSHNILRYIEERADKLEDIPEVMNEFIAEYKDIFGILLIIDGKGRCLFITDGERESYIHIKRNKVKLISNYPPNGDSGYRNVGWIIFSLDGDLISNGFEGKINKEKFTKESVTCNVTYVDTKYEKDYSWNSLFKNFFDDNVNYLKGATYHTALTWYLWEDFGVESLDGFKEAYGYVFPSGEFYDFWEDYFYKNLLG